ncbi:transposase [Mesorhizobium australicum]|uniref:transposase n=1 Tax=Mesorhizobium australicum TaxID=536018 RepID=UPI0033380051
MPHADLFGRLGRAWLTRQPVPDDERAAIQRHIRELDRLGDDLRVLDREIADRACLTKRRSITGVNLAVAAGLVAAVGDIGRSSSPQKLVSYFGLTPNVRQWGSVLPITGGLARVGRSHARAMLVEAAWAAGWQAKEERKPI